MDETEIDAGRRLLWGCLPFVFVALQLVKLLNKKDRHHKNPPVTKK